MNEGSRNLAMLSFSGATALKTPQNKSTPQSVMANNPISSTKPAASDHFYSPPGPIEFDDEDPVPVSAGFLSALKKMFR